MRFTDLLQLDVFPTTRGPERILDQVLPPNPEPPSRPTIPPPTCGTLPPVVPDLLKSLGDLGRIGR